MKQTSFIADIILSDQHFLFIEIYDHSWFIGLYSTLCLGTEVIGVKMKS